MRGHLLQEGAAPEESAGRVGAAALVELGEALVDLEALVGIGGGARLGEERVDEVAGAVAREGRAVGDDGGEKLVAEGRGRRGGRCFVPLGRGGLRDVARHHGGAGGGGGALEVAGALVLEGGLEGEARGLGACRLGGAREAPAGAIGRRLGGEALEEVAEAGVLRAGAEGLLEEGSGAGGIGRREEHGLADEVVRLLDGIGGGVAASAEDLGDAVGVLRGAGGALGEVEGDREARVLGDRLLEEAGALGGIGVALGEAGGGLCEEDGGVRAGDGVGVRREDAREVRGLAVGGARADGSLVEGVGLAGAVEIEDGAIGLAGDLGDDGGGEGAVALASGVVGVPLGEGARDAAAVAGVGVELDGERDGGAAAGGVVREGREGLRERVRAERALVLEDLGEGAAEGGAGASATFADRLDVAIGRVERGEGGAGGGGDGGGVRVLQDGADPRGDVGRGAGLRGEGREDEAIGGGEGAGAAVVLRPARGLRVAGLDPVRGHGAAREVAVRAGGDGAERGCDLAAGLLAGGGEHGGEPAGAARERGRLAELREARERAREVVAAEGCACAEQGLVGGRRVRLRGAARGGVGAPVHGDLLGGGRERGELGRVGEMDLRERGGRAGVGLGRGEGLAQALHVAARVVGLRADRQLDALAGGVGLAEAKARDLGAERRGVRAHRGDVDRARLAVEGVEHGAEVGLAVDEGADLLVSERHGGGELARLLGDRLGGRLLAGHGEELRHGEHRAGAVALVLEGLGLGPEPLCAGDPRVALLRLEEVRGGVLLVGEVTGGGGCDAMAIGRIDGFAGAGGAAGSALTGASPAWTVDSSSRGSSSAAGGATLVNATSPSSTSAGSETFVSVVVAESSTAGARSSSPALTSTSASFSASASSSSSEAILRPLRSRTTRSCSSNVSAESMRVGSSTLSSSSPPRSAKSCGAGAAGSGGGAGVAGTGVRFGSERSWSSSASPSSSVGSAPRIGAALLEKIAPAPTGVSRFADEVEVDSSRRSSGISLMTVASSSPSRPSRPMCESAPGGVLPMSRGSLLTGPPCRASCGARGSWVKGRSRGVASRVRCPSRARPASRGTRRGHRRGRGTRRPRP